MRRYLIASSCCRRASPGSCAELPIDHRHAQRPHAREGCRNLPGPCLADGTQLTAYARMGHADALRLRRSGRSFLEGDQAARRPRQGSALARHRHPAVLYDVLHRCGRSLRLHHRDKRVRAIAAPLSWKSIQVALPWQVPVSRTARRIRSGGCRHAGRRGRSSRRAPPYPRACDTPR
jgi:hypothetical protein